MRTPSSSRELGPGDSAAAADTMEFQPSTRIDQIRHARKLEEHTYMHIWICQAKTNESEHFGPSDTGVPGPV